MFKSINGKIEKDGSKFVVKGTQAFAYLFTQHEYRTDYNYRASKGSLTLDDGSSVVTGAASGISEPTYYAKYMWKGEAFVDDQLARIAFSGHNLIQVGVEPAMLNTPSYIDHVDGLTYPAEIDMLDYIIYKANSLGLVVMLRSHNDQLTVSDCESFMSALATRYKDNPMIWLNPRNEINCFGVRQSDGSLTPNPSCETPSVWKSDIEAYLSAIRGAGFVNPVVINTTGHGGDISAVESAIDASQVISEDVNLIIGTHHYMRQSDPDFTTARLSETEIEWASGLSGKYTLIIDEVGSTNFAGRWDSQLEADSPLQDPNTWSNAKTYLRQVMRWVTHNCRNGNLNGAVSFNWGAYFPNLGNIHDKNSLWRVSDNGGWSDWGGIWKSYFLDKKIERDASCNCFLDSENGGLILRRVNGDNIVIANQNIKFDEVTLSVSGLSPSTIYYIYAKNTSSGVALNASQTAPEKYFTSGLMVKSDNPEMTLVGMTYITSSGGLGNNDYIRYVRSWFNDKGVSLVRTSVNDSSTAPSNCESYALLWKGETLNVSQSGQVKITSPSLITTNICVNGVNVSKAACSAFDSSGKQMLHCSSGAHTASKDERCVISLNGSVNAGYGTWKNGYKLTCLTAGV